MLSSKRAPTVSSKRVGKSGQHYNRTLATRLARCRFCDSECDAACDAAVAFDPKFWQALGANVPRPNTRTSARGAQLRASLFRRSPYELRTFDLFDIHKMIIDG